MTTTTKTLPLSTDPEVLMKALAAASAQLELLERQQAEGSLKKTHERRTIKRQRARLLTQLRVVVRQAIEPTS